MTSKTIAAVGAALILIALAVPSAEARTQPQSVVQFDRHDVRGYVPSSAETITVARRVSIKAKRGHRYNDRPAIPKNYAARSSDHVLVAASGARTSVSTVARPHFQCLLTKLAAVGYRIDFMGGYAQRGNASAHPTGNALDINQTGRNIVTHRLPSNATEMARECGLVHGAVWSNPDQGHFEMARKYGYLYRAHRSRYAAAR